MVPPEGIVPPPSALGLVLCEGIWTDGATGKKFILRCFTAIRAREFPAIQPLLSAYILLTNSRGKVPFKVVVDVDEEREPLAEMAGENEFPDVRTVVSIDAVMMGSHSRPPVNTDVKRSSITSSSSNAVLSS
jgi:hypothetical protein